MKNYRKKTIAYFLAEYSDFDIQELIRNIKIQLKDENKFIEKKIRDLNNKNLQNVNICKWNKKIEKLICDFFKAKKPFQDAARKIALLLKIATKKKIIIKS